MANNASVTRSVPQSKPPRNPISREQVERILSRSVGLFGIVFGAQTLPIYLEQAQEAQQWWSDVIGILLFGSIVVAFVAALVNRGVGISLAFVALLYLVALGTWPFAVLDPDAVTRGNHWLYFLLTVATATAAIVFSARMATFYLVGTCLIYGVIRMTPAGAGVSLQQAALDSIYATILGGTVIIVATLLRQAASAVDAAQSAALHRYSNAVRQHATEVERVQVDAIVHDSVLTTLLSAARAFTPESKELAATMARNAMAHLRDAAKITPDDGSTVKLAAIARRIAETAMEMSSSIDVRAKHVGALSIPVHAAETMYSATVQAMVNSIQHGGTDQNVKRWLRIHPTSTGGIDIEVGDTGAGFDVRAMTKERLGVRVSILERVASVGGTAVVDSEPGVGTVVRLLWPDPVSPAPSGTDGVDAGAPEGGRSS